MDQLIAEVESRGEAANKTVEGANYLQIVRDVASENDVDFEDLRQACLDAWIAGAG